MISRVVSVFIAGFLSVTVIAAAQDAPADRAGVSMQAPAPAPAPAAFAPEPVLAGYIREALAANPGIQASQASYRAALDQVPLASALPDPMLSIGQALLPIQTRVGPQRETVTVSQMFPWPGKRDLRGRIAEQSAAAARETSRARQRDVIARVKIAFYDLAYVDAAVGIAREEQGLLEHYEELAQARYASGQGLQQAVIRIQAEITKVVNRLDTLGQQRRTIAAELNTLMSRPPAQKVPAIAPLTVPTDLTLDLQRLEALGDADRPEIKAADARIGRAARAVDLAGRNGRPDFTVGATFMNVSGRSDAAGRAQPPPDNGRNAWSVAFGFNLPIRRDRLHAERARAAEELSAARFERADARNTMALAVHDQAVRVETLGEQLRLVGDVLVPQVDEALRSTESAYETGQAGVLDLLDSERNRLDVRLVHARDAADYLVALANLERAIGAPFPEGTRVP